MAETCCEQRGAILSGCAAQERLRFSSLAERTFSVGSKRARFDLDLEDSSRPVATRSSKKWSGAELLSSERTREATLRRAASCPLKPELVTIAQELRNINIVPFPGMEVAYVKDVAALRAAVTAAVAECTKVSTVKFTEKAATATASAESDRKLGRPAAENQASPSVVTSAGDASNRSSDAKVAAPQPDTDESDSLAQLRDSKSFSRRSQGLGGLRRAQSAFVTESSLTQDPGEGATYGSGQQGCPPHGAKAICGRRPKMEDAYTTVPYLIEVPLPAELEGERIPPRIAPHLSPTPSETNDSDGDDAERQDSSHSNSTSLGSRSGPAMLEVLHFFGVFDGHGGAEAALHCAQTLHERIAESLLMAAEQSKAASQASSGVPPVSPKAAVAEAPMQRGVVACNCGTSGCGCAASGDMQSALSDEVATATGMDRDGSSGSDSSFLDRVADEETDAQAQQEGVVCSAAEIESALTDAFCKTDEEFGKADHAALVGTTAVVCLVGSRQLYVANCGDSRAVLCRNGLAIPLSDDHKAAREDETARVEAAGGQILFWNGVRVMGVLAVSRAIGDHCLRPFVIAKPEVTIVGRRPDDELLLLASDGLWDVLTNQEACSLAKRCLRRARQRGATRQSAARIAATVLTKAAVDRGSRDNVTVVVVDLMNGDDAANELMMRAPSMGDEVLPLPGQLDLPVPQQRVDARRSRSLAPPSQHSD